MPPASPSASMPTEARAGEAVGRLVDPEAVIAIIEATAKAVILPRYRNLGSGEIHQKTGPLDLVTIADTESEAMLSARLTALLPGSVVVGEEGAAADPGVLERLEGDAPVWILDPVDGTSVFARGEPGFAVIVALALRGRTIAGWIHDPLTANTAWAEAGQGAWLDRAPLRLEDGAKPLAAMKGAVWWGRRAARLKDKVAAIAPWGSAGKAYMALATGELDFAIFRRLNPWDHAAGVLLHGEAGGANALLDGEPYRPVPLDGGLLMAPGQRSWNAIRDLLGD